MTIWGKPVTEENVMQKHVQNLNQEGERKMIKAEKGTVEIKGEIKEILTDFEMTGRAMKEVLTREMGEEKAKEEWEKAIKNSEKSVEERMEGIVEELTEEIAEGIRKMIADRK